jgi:hypothetical protein
MADTTFSDILCENPRWGDKLIDGDSLGTGCLFLSAAIKHGTVTFISRNESCRFNRFLVTVGNESRPMDISDELCRELKLKV